MRLTDSKAKKILNFLTKRMGYESWRLYESFSMPGMLSIEFLDDKEYGVDLLIEKYIQLKTWCFYSDMSLKQIVKSMIENQDHAYCSINEHCEPLCKDLIATYPWIYVFKKNESLESLLIESDLNG